MDRQVKRTLAGWCVVVTLFGLGLAGAGFEATDGFTRLTFRMLGHPGPALTPELRFAVALMGAVTMGWGLTLSSVAAVSDRLDPGLAGSVWRRIAASASAWFVIDSSLSIATGFALNAVSNIVLLAALLAILWRAGVLSRA